MKRLALLLALFALVGLTAACGTVANQKLATGTTNVVKQLPGVVAALGDVAKAAPLDISTKASVQDALTIASTAAEVIASVSGASSTTDAVSKLSGAVQTVNTAVQASAADASMKSQAANYASWAVFALKVAAVLLPAVL